MTNHRKTRTLLDRAARAVVALGCVLLAGSAAAAGYPDKPITVINPWTSGGPADTVARPVLQKLSERLGQPVIMDVPYQAYFDSSSAASITITRTAA